MSTELSKPPRDTMDRLFYSRPDLTINRDKLGNLTFIKGLPMGLSLWMNASVSRSFDKVEIPDCTIKVRPYILNRPITRVTHLKLQPKGRGLSIQSPDRLTMLNAHRILADVLVGLEIFDAYRNLD